MLDAYSTQILVQHFGIDVEANPLIHYAMSIYGVLGMYMVKFAVLGFLGLVTMFVYRYYMEHRAAIILHRCTWLLTVLLAIIVVNNFILVAAAINT